MPSLSSPSRRSRRAAWPLLALLALVALPACAVRFIADYDAGTEAALHQLAQEVDAFYLALEERPEGDRPYPDFAGDYQRIEALARALVRRNRVRELNEDSTAIAESFLELWQDSRRFHRDSGGYPDFDLREDWSELQEVLDYALRAEGAKPRPTA